MNGDAKMYAALRTKAANWACTFEAEAKAIRPEAKAKAKAKKMASRPRTGLENYITAVVTPSPNPTTLNPTIT